MFNRAAFKKFGRDEKGNVIIMTALVATPLLLAVGAAVDTAEVYRAKTTYQNAVDAAALTVAKQIRLTGDRTIAEAAGKRVFDANLENLPASTGTIAFSYSANAAADSCGEDGITAVASLRHPTFFDGIHKIYTDQGDPNHANIDVKTIVKCGTGSVEVALVLDNSGSMRGGKIATLITEAKKLVDTLHAETQNAAIQDPMKFSLVPFSTFVNVGPSNRDEAWMDNDGVSPIHHENLDWSKDPSAVAVALNDGTNRYVKSSNNEALTRFSIYDALNIEWKGCVEQRPYPYHTTDAEPDPTDYKSMFVPSFAPDMPDNWSGQRDKIRVTSGSGNSLYCTRWRKRRGRLVKCRRWSDGTRAERDGSHYSGLIPNPADYNPDGSYNPQSNGSVWVDDDWIWENRYVNNYVRDDHNFPDDPAQHPRSKENTGSSDQMKRQRWTWKYFPDSSGNDAEVGDVNNNNYGVFPTAFGFEGGPNNFCTSAQLTRLTADQDKIKDDIDNMYAEGATNIQHGMMWGWRSLSAREPLAEGRPKSDEDNRKIMIVMTDGNNTYYTSQSLGGGSSDQNVSFYGAHGHQSNGRLYEGYDEISNPSHNNSTYTKAMDEHMAEACVNIQDDGISVYTIAFDVPNGSSVKALLEQCATKDTDGKPQYFDAQNSQELAQAFKDIAADISEVAISR